MAKKNETVIHIGQVQKGEVTFCLVGETGFMNNKLPEKAKRQLLLPQPGRRSRQGPKHEVMDEFKNSPHVNPNDDGETLITMVSAAFRKAMMTAALEIPGVKKTQVARLIWVKGERVPMFGIPSLDLRPITCAGINKAPDIRIRAFMEKWAAKVTVSFIEPQFTAAGVANLLAAAGTFIGVGDGRNEKGALNYGLWNIVQPDDEEFLYLTENCGRAAQIEAMENPHYSNPESEDLYIWYVEAMKEFQSLKPAKKAKKANGVTAQA